MCLVNEVYFVYSHLHRPNLYIEVNTKSSMLENDFKCLLVSSKNPATGRSHDNHMTC